MKSPHLSLIVSVVVASLGAACGGGASNSLLPTGPSGLSGGALITGRVTGVSTSTTRSTLGVTSPLTASPTTALTTTTSLKVTVDGTQISSSVDGAGQFTLDGVPPGTVRLTFTGRDVNASITLSGVSSGDRVQIEVRLDGDRAQVENDVRHHDGDTGDDDDGDDHDGDDDGDGRGDGLEIKGLASALGGTCPVVTFKVGARTVATSSTTVFRDLTCAGLKDGVRVEVHGTLTPAGTLAAARVELDD